VSGVYGLDLFNYASMCDVGAARADFDGDDFAELGELQRDGRIVTFDTCVGATFFFVCENNVDIVAQ
jgi:hypothetical protein